ncbi:hypothetical protein GBA52_028458 [Prunus armeniaca]|nr:hypothetical protein GBA52_028458 [Prunus armeniaca]
MAEEGKAANTCQFWRPSPRLASRSQLSSQVKGFKAQEEQSNKHEQRGPGNNNLCLCLCCSHSTFGLFF